MYVQFSLQKYFKTEKATHKCRKIQNKKKIELWLLDYLVLRYTGI